MGIKVKKAAVFLLVLCVLCASAGINAFGEQQRLIPAGTAFGIKFFTKGALVVGLTSVETASGMRSPATEAGISVGDIITEVNGKAISNAEDFKRIIAECGTKAVSLTIKRNGDVKSVTVKAESELASGTPKIGLWVRDSTAGIGTVTYVRENGDFAGLGHGICDSATGVLLPLGDGAVVDVTVTGVVKGVRNAPGELKGVFGSVREGTLSANTETGVYGRLNDVSEFTSQALPIGKAHKGAATIMCTLGNDGVKSYGIEIEKIVSDGETKNFVIHVTDAELINRAGGIVQGMSGSPVIQDGAIVGAVTHVLVGDPTRGYGIFITNMVK